MWGPYNYGYVHIKLRLRTSDHEAIQPLSNPMEIEAKSNT